MNVIPETNFVFFCFFLFDNECCFKLYCILYADDTELMVEPVAYIQKITKLCQIILKVSVGYPIHLMFLNYKGGVGAWPTYFNNMRWVISFPVCKRLVYDV